MPQRLQNLLQNLIYKKIKKKKENSKNYLNTCSILANQIVAYTTDY